MADPVVVRLVGAGEATVVVDERAIVIDAAGRELAVPLAALGGVRVSAGDARSIALHAGGAALELAPRDDAGEAFDALGHDIVAAAYALPEVMRGLRAYGSSRAQPGAEHDRFFAPLVRPLRELRAAHEQALGRRSAPWRAAESVDATRAGAELRATLAAFAVERFPRPESAPDRRALEAELEDEAEELFDRLDALTAAAQRLHAAADVERVAAWRAWTAALAATLDAADRCWSRSTHALGATPTSPRTPRTR